MDVIHQLNAGLAGRYSVEREIGAGGMATVFLARDLRHERRVALKVLKPELGAVLGADRFLAEIKVTAHLQHPNLLPLFDSGEADGLLYYVMPYVEGESLRQRLAREKQLPVELALHLGTAIASALDYAHRQGVIHRDLKPENVLLHEGQPLIADFGIALAVSKAGGARVTQTGISLGTPQYMSPEQATGDRVIDGRADIYALGVLLYEMLTGDPPYLGSTAQAIIAKVLTDRPRNVRALRVSVPAHVASTVERALEKLPADRFATAQEFSDALRERPRVLEGAAPPEPVAMRGSRRISATTTSVGAIALVASVLAAWGWLRHPPREGAPTTRFPLTLPAGMGLNNNYAPPTVSHDGRVIFAKVQVGDVSRLAWRRIDELDVHLIPGTEGAAVPVASPDDKSLAFVADGQIRKIRIDGGQVVPVTNTPVAHGFDWAPNDTLVVGAGERSDGLSIVPASGGTLQPLTKLTRGEVWHAWPRVLPDGNTVVYVSWPKEGMPGARLAVTTLKSRGADARILDVPGTTPIGMADGHLLYVRGDGVLMAVPFDMRSRTTTGAAIVLATDIGVNRLVGRARVGLSDAGTLVYLPGGIQLVASDLAGTEQTLTTELKNFDAPRWSPDGRRIAVLQTVNQGTDVWLYEVASGGLSPFTSDGHVTSLSWTSTGNRIVFVSTDSGRQTVWARGIAGGVAEKLFELRDTVIAEAILAPDGRTLVYRTLPTNEIYSVDVAAKQRPTPIDLQRFTGWHLALSPSGKWLAYASREGLVVRPFPGPGASSIVSPDAATDLVWSPDGSQLYYRLDRQVKAVTVTPGSNVVRGALRELFEGPYISLGGGGPSSMSISPDGKRLVLLKQADSRLIVTTNWFTELRERLGSKSR